MDTGDRVVMLIIIILGVIEIGCMLPMARTLLDATSNANDAKVIEAFGHAFDNINGALIATVATLIGRRQARSGP
jgi:hypothetical protein